jgi:NAD(P)-dependent dehydrogenase (short-subunit alcohol dehydrogenase family)
MAGLTNKIALVTGASRGLGQAAARSLAHDGARVLVHYGRGREEAESLVSEIRGAGGYAEAIAADLAAADGAHVLAEKVRKIVDGKLDILVANAGISKSVPIEGLTVEEFDRLFAVNVRAPRSAVAAGAWRRLECDLRFVHRSALGGRHDRGLRSDEGRGGHLGEALCRGARSARDSCERRRARRG